MKRVVFDIETVGVDFESLDKQSQEYFLKFSDTPEKREEVKNSLSFYPLTAQIIAVGLMDVDSEHGIVYYQDGEKHDKGFKQENVSYIACPEKKILMYFWNQICQYDQFITFNGRLFDCPFLMLRSAIHHIRPSRNLMPYRYSYAAHVDLIDQLSFYDAMRKKFNLHMWCQAFGIRSPKEGDITGVEISDYFLKGKYIEIAKYCLHDVIATKELFLSWEKNLKF